MFHTLLQNTHSVLESFQHSLDLMMFGFPLVATLLKETHQFSQVQHYARIAEMDIQPGETLIGRPLGMSCGCPITHCGVAMQVDHRTGVIVWCVTGPLRPRQQGFKDLGY
jgi:hypothetical protein